MTQKCFPLKYVTVKIEVKEFSNVKYFRGIFGFILDALQ